MGIIMVPCPTFCCQLAVGLWHSHGCLLHIYSTPLVLSGKSEYLLVFLVCLEVYEVLCTGNLSTANHPHQVGFHLTRTVEDFRDWTNWLFYRGGIGVKGEESWEAWWDEELVRPHDLNFISWKGMIICFISNELKA